MARPASVSARPLSFVIRTENFTAARVMNRLHELFSAGTHTRWHSLMGSGRTLAVHMYALLSEGLYTDQAYATAVVLLVLVFIINRLSAFAAGKLQNR